MKIHISIYKHIYTFFLFFNLERSGLPFPSPVIKYEVSEGSEVKSLSCVRLFATPWTVAYQAPLSMGFSRQEYWTGLPFPSKTAIFSKMAY